jgi:DNA mismatch repair protein MutS
VTIDPKTLKDLEIWGRPNSGASGVIQLIDRTRTRVGRENLRGRLTRPYGSVSEISDAQQTHAFLAARADSLRLLIESTICDGVERYLEGPWPLPRLTTWSSGVLEGYVSTLPRAYFYEVESGQFRIKALLQVALELQTQLDPAPTAQLRALQRQLSELLESEELVALSGYCCERSRRGRLRFDRHARGIAKRHLHLVLHCIGATDAMLSLGLATTEHGWSYPTFGDSLAIKGLFHPLLASSIPNDVVTDDVVRLAFVSGPNMSGKSTLLKAIGIAVLLGQAGCGVPAEAMSFRPARALFASLGVTDDLARGESYYLAEVRRLRALAETINANPRTLALLDEPFRGTNTEDAIEATRAIASRLACLPQTLTFVASHLSQAVASFHDHRGVCTMHFSASVKEGDIEFDYMMRAGLSTQRLGIALLQHQEVLDLLDAAARPSDESANLG